MLHFIRPTSPRAFRGAYGPFLGALLMLVAACGPAQLPPGDTIADASEAQNRATHEMNLALDRALVSPAADAYGSAIPEPIRTGVNNFSSNLNQPSYVLNNLLQARLDDAMQNTLRFAINSTIGVGGVFDPATALGLPAEETDFGETLHIYGVPEGDYHVIPLIGPSTTRDTVGRVVDFAMNPLRQFVDAPESDYLTLASIAAGLGSRYDFGGTIDDVLYNSEDSYVQLRSLYLQSRRYELRGDDPDAYLDPYAEAVPGADPLADPYYDPYSDPYFDPYAQ